MVGDMAIVDMTCLTCHVTQTSFLMRTVVSCSNCVFFKEKFYLKYLKFWVEGI